MCFLKMTPHISRLLLVLATGATALTLSTPTLRCQHHSDAYTRATPVRCSEAGELEGWVSSRRILGSAMAFIDVHAAPDDVELTAQRDPVQVLLKASADGEGLRHPLDRSFYAVGARVRVTGHWRARGGKAAQSEQWLLVAHTVCVLTAAPSVHGVRSVLDATRCGSMSAAAASAALVYVAGRAVGPSEGSAVAALVAEYAARAEPSAEQAPLAASDGRVVDRLLRQLRASLPSPIVRAALATDGQRPALKAASVEMQPDETSLAAVLEEMRQLGGAVAAAAALETSAPVPGASAMARASGGGGGGSGGGGGGVAEGDGPAAAAAVAAAAAAAGWLVVEAEVAKRRRVLASGSIVGSSMDSSNVNVSMCVLELQDELVKAHGGRANDDAAAAAGAAAGAAARAKSPAPAPLLALAHPALHTDDAADLRRLDALKQLGATGARVRLAGRWVEAASGGRRMLLVRAWRLGP